MHKFLTMAGCFLLVACVTSDDRSTCLKRGYKEGTGIFNECMEDLREAREKRARDSIDQHRAAEKRQKEYRTKGIR